MVAAWRVDASVPPHATHPPTTIIINPTDQPTPIPTWRMRSTVSSAMRRYVVHFPPVTVTSFPVDDTSMTWFRDRAAVPSLIFSGS